MGESTERSEATVATAGRLVSAFRNAESGDIAAIVALVESAYRGDASRAGWTTEADLLDGQRTDADEISALIARPGSRIVLAEAGDGEAALLACCHIERHDDVCHFGMFSVLAPYQRSGLGRRMLAHAESIARDEWRCHEMRMHVIDVRTELMAWYERRGYRRTGVHAPFPYGDARFGLPKRPDLRFELMVKPL